MLATDIKFQRFFLYFINIESDFPLAEKFPGVVVSLHQQSIDDVGFGGMQLQPNPCAFFAFGCVKLVLGMLALLATGVIPESLEQMSAAFRPLFGDNAEDPVPAVEFGNRCFSRNT